MGMLESAMEEAIDNVTENVELLEAAIKEGEGTAEDGVEEAKGDGVEEAKGVEEPEMQSRATATLPGVAIAEITTKPGAFKPLEELKRLKVGGSVIV